MRFFTGAILFFIIIVLGFIFFLPSFPRATDGETITFDHDNVAGQPLTPAWFEKSCASCHSLTLK